MSRAMTAADAPPILDPTPEIEAAVLRYAGVQASTRRVILAPESSHEVREFWRKESRKADQDLETLLLEQPRWAWYPVGEWVWGLAKTSKRGGEVVRKPRWSPLPR